MVKSEKMLSENLFSPFASLTRLQGAMKNGGGEGIRGRFAPLQLSC